MQHVEQVENHRHMVVVRTIVEANLVRREVWTTLR